jgi:putative membrane protein
MRYSCLLPAGLLVSTVAMPAYAKDMNTTSASGFVTMAATSDMYEVQAGKLAGAKAVSPAVKAFGTHMVQAHTETSAKLKTAVKKSGLAISPPAQLDGKHQQMISELNSAGGSDFDRTYLSQQESAHQEALNLMRTYANSGDNGVLRQAPANTVPVVQDHIAMLEKLKSGR